MDSDLEGTEMDAGRSRVSQALGAPERLGEDAEGVRDSCTAPGSLVVVVVDIVNVVLGTALDVAVPHCRRY